MGTAIVTTVLAVVVAAILYKMIKDKLNGKSSCGCNCGTCNACASGKKKGK